jgi:hypothetical protein
MLDQCPRYRVKIPVLEVHPPPRLKIYLIDRLFQKWLIDQLPIYPVDNRTVSEFIKQELADM